MMKRTDAIEQKKREEKQSETKKKKITKQDAVMSIHHLNDIQTDDCKTRQIKQIASSNRMNPITCFPMRLSFCILNQ